jgi:hypothetical protein
MKNSVSLRNFWPDNDTTKFFLVDLMQSIPNSSKKVVITSVFIKRTIIAKIINYVFVRFSGRISINRYQKIFFNLNLPVKKNNELNIWYTGENIRPPLEPGWDAILSFETDKYLPRNIYLPFWATRLGKSVKEAKEIQSKFTQNRELSLKKSKFACAIISNPQPTRMLAINEISKIGKVDLFGSVFKNRIESKKDILKKYNFNICFENDLYPGYVTEKIFDAWQEFAIPIWWGIDSAEYINQQAIINFADLGFSEGLRKIKFLLENPSEMKKIQEMPILRKDFNYDELVRDLTKLLSK